MTLDQLKALYQRAKDAYYNTDKPIMSDEKFDKLEQTIKRRDPGWVPNVGYQVMKKVKAKLPIPMFSLNKVKINSVDRWLADDGSRYYVVSEKLDGSALEIVYQKGRPVKAFTRGNGIYGGDVSFMIPHLRVPQKVGTSDVVVRTEAIFMASKFKKYQEEFNSARNASSGILNRQDIHPAMKDISVVVLQVLHPNVLLSKGLAWAKAKGFTVVPHVRVDAKNVNSSTLSKLLAKRRQFSKFKIDGLVITSDDKPNPLPKTGNPGYSVAFKMNESAENNVTTVVDVIWEVSSRGQIIPTIRVKPVDFDGASVQYTSGDNAAYVVSNKLGPGAKVTLVRSGEIIPRIVEILKPGKVKLPDPKVVGPYSWDKNKTHFVLDNPKQSDEFRVKVLARFFGTIGVEFLKERSIRRLYENGLNSVTKIVNASPRDLSRVPGVQAKTAEKLWGALHKVLDAGIPLIVLMDASGVFPKGMGQTRLESIAGHYDLMKLMQQSPEDQRKALLQLPGFQATTAELFVKGAPIFLKWYKMVGIKAVAAKAKAVVKTVSKKLSGQSITFTGYRNADQEHAIEQNGGKVVPFGSKTSILLYSPEGKLSSKISKAEQRGLTVMTWDELKRKYRL